MKIIAIINQKGGVGKTTSVVNIGAGLTRRGKRVLVMDMDPQSHLTFSLGVQPDDVGHGMYELLKGTASVDEVITERLGMGLISSSLDLSGLEVELAERAGREHMLRDAIGGLSGYDYILMDCPPTMGLLSLNAMVAAEEVYIPLQAEFLALQGVSRLVQSIQRIKERLNPALIIGGLITTRYDRRKGLNREVHASLKEHFSKELFKTVIRDNIALAEAPSYGMSIFDYRASSNGAEDYASLCKEIVKRSES